MVTVVLAEDSYLMREGITSVLAEMENVEVVATCGDYDELIAAVADHGPDLVLTDIRMPPTQTDEGIRAANEIREAHPETAVVVLSQYVEPAYALDLFASGSSGKGYLLKERVGDLAALEGAFSEVMKGGSAIDPQVVEALVQARIKEQESLVHRLSPRELEVLGEMAQGRNNAGIADALSISQRAVEKHINSIFTKLDLGFEEETHRRVRAVLLYLSEQT